MLEQLEISALGREKRPEHSRVSFLLKSLNFLQKVGLRQENAFEVFEWSVPIFVAHQLPIPNSLSDWREFVMAEIGWQSLRCLSIVDKAMKEPE
jgi:hypothetical protein